MSTPIVHLIDDDTSAACCRLIGSFASRGSSDFEHTVALLGRQPADWPGRYGIAQAVRCPLRWRWPTAWAPRLESLLREKRAALVHAWGASAAQAAGIAARRLPLVMHARARQADDLSRWIRSSVDGAPRAVVCDSQMIFRRCLEAGTPPERCTVIRPGVDFAVLTSARREARRGPLGLQDDARVLLAMPVVDRAGGHELVIWATAVLEQLWPDVRIVIPGSGRAQRRLVRLASAMDRAYLTCWPGDRRSWPELLAIADVLVVPATGDFDTTAIVWAMAAGVPIVGAATPALAEFIVEARNGLLCRPGRFIDLARKVRQLLSDRGLCVRLADTARAQAYDVHSLAHCIEQHERLWGNLLAGRAVKEGIKDAALIA
jgi:glycosyltransferase involved in cell wall biosynthesis